MGRLTALQIKAAIDTPKPGVHPDGDGLFLKVDPRGGASWKLRIQHEGKRRDYSLGSAKLMTLAQARTKAADYRRMVRVEGRDPIAEKRQARAAAMTFREAALAQLAVLKPQWASEKHADQWIATLETYAFPKLGALPVGKIETSQIIAALLPIWTERPETARRVRQRICAVLDFAHGQGWRASEAPVRSLAVGKGLPRQPGGRHHPSLPYEDIPAFLTRLRASGGVWGRLALELLILTGVRSKAVRLAAWAEFDLENALWTVPCDHTKMKRCDHVVPLSPQAVGVLRSAAAVRLSGTELVFPGTNGRPMSDMTLLAVLRRMKEPYTVHGFRASFRTWVADKTNFPREVAEAALEHQNPNEVERAYQRGTMLEKRRKLMEAWGAYCDGGIGKVVTFKARATG